LPADKVHLSVYSPPFGGLYVYSSSERDLSNSTDYAQFFRHYAFVVRELERSRVPGRMTAVHCADVPSGNSGGDHMVDFSGDIIRLHQAEGWNYIARYSVWKERSAFATAPCGRTWPTSRSSRTRRGARARRPTTC